MRKEVSRSVMEETFVLRIRNSFVIQEKDVNRRGFTKEEYKEYVSKNKIKDYEVISIDKEIQRYKLQGDKEHRRLLNQEVYQFETWHNAVCDKTISGITLPIKVDSNEKYIEKLDAKLKQFCKLISKPAFIYEKDLIYEIRQSSAEINYILKLLINGEFKLAEEKLKVLVSQYVDNPFLVNDLNKSYSFRGLAPYKDMRSKDHGDIYELMNEKTLSFFRVRTKNKGSNEKILKRQDILHLPYKQREKATDTRFSRDGVPCIYLGTTTYVCSKECDWNPDIQDLYASVFVPNSQGNKLKILNLTVSPALINGLNHMHCEKEWQYSLIKVFPLVIATSFKVLDKNRDKKYEYLISQTLMKVISEMGIDGIAYLSMKGKNEFQYPQGVNLAIPAFDISEEKPYSKYCEMFDVSDPIVFKSQVDFDQKSYINSVYTRYDFDGYEVFMSKIDIDGKDIFYEDTKFAKYDNFLVSQIKR